MVYIVSSRFDTLHLSCDVPVIAYIGMLMRQMSCTDILGARFSLWTAGCLLLLKQVCQVGRPEIEMSGLFIEVHGYSVCCGLFS